MTISTLSRQLARARACEQRIERRALLGRVGNRLGLMHSLAIQGITRSVQSDPIDELMGQNLIGLRALLRTELRSIDAEFWRTQQGELFERIGGGR